MKLLIAFVLSALILPAFAWAQSTQSQNAVKENPFKLKVIPNFEGPKKSSKVRTLQNRIRNEYKKKKK